ncbi:MAG: hypothetical protein L3K17_03275 [Thermoplasmata archaeon]|nr:hypothetical protein [Thermoplasmata archaeon]
MSAALRSSRDLGLVLVVVVLLVISFAPLLLAGQARAAVNYPPLTGAVAGPTTVGQLTNTTYHVTAQGGPAEAENGTTVGIYDYHAYVSADNLTGLKWGPASVGVLVNNSINLTFSAGNHSESVTLAVLVTSTLNGTNATQNFTLLVAVVQPYVISTTLEAASGLAVSSFVLTVLLDGSPVGTIKVNSISADTASPISFRYVNTDLASGWHTFSISLAAEHGLVTFAGGTETFSESFYVAPPPADNTIWYVTGAVAFFGAIFIWTLRVGARRRGKSKK